MKKKKKKNVINRYRLFSIFFANEKAADERNFKDEKVPANVIQFFYFLLLQTGGLGTLLRKYIYLGHIS